MNHFRLFVIFLIWQRKIPQSAKWIHEAMNVSTNQHLWSIIRWKKIILSCSSPFWMLTKFCSRLIFGQTINAMQLLRKTKRLTKARLLNVYEAETNPLLFWLQSVQCSNTLALWNQHSATFNRSITVQLKNACGAVKVVNNG